MTSTTHTHAHTPPTKARPLWGYCHRRKGEMVPQAVSLPLPQAARVTVLRVWQCVPFGAYSHQGPAHPARFPGSLAPLLLELQGFHLHPGRGISLVLVCTTLWKSFLCWPTGKRKTLERSFLDSFSEQVDACHSQGGLGMFYELSG